MSTVDVDWKSLNCSKQDFRLLGTDAPSLVNLTPVSINHWLGNSELFLTTNRYTPTKFHIWLGTVTKS